MNGAKIWAEYINSKNISRKLQFFYIILAARVFRYDLKLEIKLLLSQKRPKLVNFR